MRKPILRFQPFTDALSAVGRCALFVHMEQMPVPKDVGHIWNYFDAYKMKSKGPLSLFYRGEKQMEAKTQMEIDAELILKVLGKAEDDDRKKNSYFGPREFYPDEVQESIGLTPNALNDAVELLGSKGYLEIRGSLGLGTSPYKFKYVELTIAGRNKYQRLLAQA